MSKQLSAAASKEFDDEVKHQYQSMEGAGELEQAVVVRRNVVGDTYNFRRMGKGLAKQKTVSQADLIPLDVSHDLIPVVLQNWHASEYTDIFDKATVNFDEMSELAMTIAWSLKRREDQLIIDALNNPPSAAGTIAGAVPILTPAGVASDSNPHEAFNVSKLRRASALLNAQGVPGKGRHIAHTAEALDQLLGTTATTSADFNGVKTLVNGDVDTFIGFKHHLIDDRDEGGLPGASATRTQLAWHQMSTGIAIGISDETTVDWVPQKGSWLSTGFLKANATVRDAAGVVTITSNDDRLVFQGANF